MSQTQQNKYRMVALMKGLDEVLPYMKDWVGTFEETEIEGGYQSLGVKKEVEVRLNESFHWGWCKC